MIVFPNAKINLGLHVTERRADGFHEIETIMYPVTLCDALEVVERPGEPFSLTISGITLPPDSNDNLCARAYHLIREQYNLPALQMYLHKNIPVGAGLGGGSADAVFTLSLLNTFFKLEISAEVLHEMAASLGSDCPFFLENKPMLATGRGEVLNPLPGFDLKGWHIVIVTPAIHVPTTNAYKEINPKKPALPLAQIIQYPVEEWKGLMINDFEDSIFRKFPSIKTIKENLYHSGAIYAAMSGSGSSIYGLYKELPSLSLSKVFEDCKVWKDTI